MKLHIVTHLDNRGVEQDTFDRDTRANAVDQAVAVLEYKHHQRGDHNLTVCDHCQAEGVDVEPVEHEFWCEHCRQ